MVRRITEERARLGKLGRDIDLSMVARSAHTLIWHTPNTVDPPLDTPDEPKGALYRGIPSSDLAKSLENGIDVPRRAPFYADRLSKAWEYACRQEGVITVLSFDPADTERSFQSGIIGGPAWVPDTATYPNRYIDGENEVYTRFDPERRPGAFLDEYQYGRWIPGDARRALRHVLLGGDAANVESLLDSLELPAQFRIVR